MGLLNGVSGIDFSYGTSPGQLRFLNNCTASLELFGRFHHIDDLIMQTMAPNDIFQYDLTEFQSGNLRANKDLEATRTSLVLSILSLQLIITRLVFEFSTTSSNMPIYYDGSIISTNLTTPHCKRLPECGGKTSLNVGMSITATSIGKNEFMHLECLDSECPVFYKYPSEDKSTHAVSAYAIIYITFCPDGSEPHILDAPCII